MMKRRGLDALLILLPILIVVTAGVLVVMLLYRPAAGAQSLLGGTGNEAGATATQGSVRQGMAIPPVEQPVTAIPLGGPLADDSVEISGLAWYGDTLMMLPQYPRHATGGEEGYIYGLAKADILSYLDGRTSGPLEPMAVPFDAHTLRDRMEDFQGFESIGFSGDRVYLTIEAGSGNDMMGYLVSGQVAPDLSRIVIDTEHLVPIEPQAALDNKADEALLVLDDRLLTFYEANGASVNPRPVAHVFDLDLNPLGTLPVPSLEYRITDAARIPAGNRFWVINTFVFADFELYSASDPLADRYGKGPTHSRFPVVERLVEMKYDPSGITFSGDAPIQLQLAPFNFRNWEGLALLDDRGFLLATDKYPSTILAFVPMP